MKRRDFVRALGIASGTAAVPRTAAADEAGGAAGTSDPVGVLVDTTKCIGCRTCEFACAEANGLPEPDENLEPTPERQTSTTEWTVVQAHHIADRPIFAKRQCLHCLQPACASACLTKAMRKTPDGPVTWNGRKCMGCRFCMVSCPFDVPKFEYHSANPRIQKCQLCAARVVEGKQPACVEACPAEALTFGRRENLLEEARHRIYTEPSRYVHRIYGEQEAGGTSWLYLAGVPFDQIGFKTDIGTTPLPTYAKEFLYAVPLVLTVVPPLLLGLRRATGKDDDGEEGGVA
jgi:Fe-S-cluster-containing dehydrogenase component